MRGDDLHQRHIAAAALANEAAALASSYFQDRARMGTKMKGFQDFVTEADGHFSLPLWADRTYRFTATYKLKDVTLVVAPTLTVGAQPPSPVRIVLRAAK